jgi:hypothetical protein
MSQTSTPGAGMLGSIREFFVLRGAERTVAAYSPAEHALVKAHTDSARRRLATGRRTLDDVSAAVLLLDAVRHYLMGARVASGRAEAEAETGDLTALLPPLPADPERPAALPTDDTRVRAALSTADPLAFDRLSPEEAARCRAALERAAVWLAGRVEARSLLNLRATRWGRIAGASVLAIYAVVATIAAIWLPKNVARDKPVHPSSTRHGDGKELVDGEIDTVPGVMTGVEESPNVTIDLGDPYALDEIRVYNRIDQAFDDCLPLAVELSADGVTFKQVARRDDHFSADPPWVIRLRHDGARAVRLRVMKRGYLALSEVEVYGKKLPSPPKPPTGR